MQNPNLYHYLFVLFDLSYIPQNRTNWGVWLVHFADCFCVRCLKAQIVGWFYSVHLWEINIFVKMVFRYSTVAALLVGYVRRSYSRSRSQCFKLVTMQIELLKTSGFLSENPFFCSIDKFFAPPWLYATPIVASFFILPPIFSTIITPILLGGYFFLQTNMVKIPFVSLDIRWHKDTESCILTCLKYVFFECHSQGKRKIQFFLK